MGDWSWQVSVEAALKTLNERNRILDTDAEALRSTVKSSFDQLRRHLDEQEARLLSGVEEQAQSSRRQIEDSEANISTTAATTTLPLYASHWRPCGLVEHV